jgi:hypothetical protein
VSSLDKKRLFVHTHHCINPAAEPLDFQSAHSIIDNNHRTTSTEHRYAYLRAYSRGPELCRYGAAHCTWWYRVFYWACITDFLSRSARVQLVTAAARLSSLRPGFRQHLRSFRAMRIVPT